MPGVDLDDLAYGMLHSSQIRGGRNYAGFRDVQIDAWLEEGRRAVDPQARTGFYRRIERRLDGLQPYTCLFVPMTQAALSRRITGIRPSPRGIMVQYPGITRLKVKARESG